MKIGIHSCQNPLNLLALNSPGTLVCRGSDAQRFILSGLDVAESVDDTDTRRELRRVFLIDMISPLDVRRHREVDVEVKNFEPR